MLDKANLVGKNLCQGKNDYETGGIFYSFFLAPIKKFCLTVKVFGVIQRHMTFKGFINSRRLVDQSQYFDMLKGKKISAMLPKSWKKSSNIRIVIPAKMRNCDKCRGKTLCATCNSQINEKKNSKLFYIFLKREAPNEFGYMLPYFID